VLLQVGSCLGSFLKSFGDAALPYVETLMPSIAPLLDKARPDEERRIAMCIIDDMLEHSAQGRAKYLTQVRLPLAGVWIVRAAGGGGAATPAVACYSTSHTSSKALQRDMLAFCL
jgi:hypothetical protein